MDNPLFNAITQKAKEAFRAFIYIAFGGTLLSFVLIILIDFVHSNFCTQISNLYFWRCFNSLWVHILFLLLFPLAYFIFAITFAQKYLVYLIVELIIQKAKYQSVDWVLQYIPLSLEPIIKKLSRKLKIPDNKIEQVVEYLLNLPFQKISDLFMPSLNSFWIILALEIIIFIWIWVRL